MASIAAQALAVAAGGALLLAITLVLTRRGLLSLRYGLGWLAVSLLVVGGAALLGFVKPLASALRITPTGLLLAVVAGFLLLVSLQLSVSLSRVQEAIRDLSESHALLEVRLRETEQSAPVETGGSAPSDPEADVVP